MPKIPPDNSIVSIKSYLHGTYLSACSDHRSVTLIKVDDPNKLPQNCLWTLRTQPVAGYSIGSLRFISCYGRYLATKGLVWREVCQDNPITGYTRFCFAGWTYDRVGTTHCHDGFRLMVSLSAYYLTVNKKNGQVSIGYHPTFLCTEPEVYWTINQVGINEDGPIVPAMPRELRSGDGVRADDDDQRETRRGGKGIVFHFAINNNPMAINTGMNENKGSGDQCVGGVKAANIKKQYADVG